MFHVVENWQNFQKNFGSESRKNFNPKNDKMPKTIMNSISIFPRGEMVN